MQNALKEVVLSGRSKVGYCDLLKSTYIFLNHKVDDDGFISFLLNNKVPTRTIFGKFDYPVRKVREISKSLRSGVKEVKYGT